MEIDKIFKIIGNWNELNKTTRCAERPLKTGPELEEGKRVES